MKIENVAVISLEDYAEYQELKNKKNRNRIKVGDIVCYSSEPHKSEFGNGVVRYINKDSENYIEVEFENVTGGITCYPNCTDKSKGWYCKQSDLILL